MWSQNCMWSPGSNDVLSHCSRVRKLNLAQYESQAIWRNTRVEVTVISLHTGKFFKDFNVDIFRVSVQHSGCSPYTIVIKCSPACRMGYSDCGSLISDGSIPAPVEDQCHVVYQYQ